MRDRSISRPPNTHENTQNKTSSVRINVTLRRIRKTTVVAEKQYYILRVCVCSLSYAAQESACAVLSCGLPGSTAFFHVISQTARLLEKRYWTKDVCFDSLYKFFWNFSHSKKNSARYYLPAHCPLFLSHFNETWPFSTYFRKIFKYQISWQSIQWESSCSMRMDRQAGRQIWRSCVFLSAILRTRLKIV